MLGSCQWTVCPQHGDTKMHPETACRAVMGTLVPNGCLWQGLKGQVTQAAGAGEVGWFLELLCPHFNADVGQLLSVPTSQHCSISSAQPFAAPSLIPASCPRFLLCSHQLPRSCFTIFKPHLQTWEFFKRKICTNRCFNPWKIQGC